jgi:hypothetical protein
MLGAKEEKSHHENQAVGGHATRVGVGEVAGFEQVLEDEGEGDEGQEAGG